MTIKELDIKTSCTKTKASSVVSPCFQIVSMCISGAFIIIFMSIGLSRIRINEKLPYVEVVTPRFIKSQGGEPTAISAGLYIEQFHVFDMINNKFLFTGAVWFLCDPDSISVSTLSKFNFYRSQIIALGDPYIKMLGKQLFVRFPVRVEVTADLNYQYFPLDDHRIYFVLTHPEASPESILLSSTRDKFFVKPDMRFSGWNEIDTQVKFGYNQSILDQNDPQKNFKFSIVVFSIDYERSGLRYVFSILLPLLLIFYLTLFSFSFSDLSGRAGLSLATGSITAILAYRFVIENISPHTGYFMLSDYLFFLFLSGSTVVFFINMIDQFALNFSFSARAKKIIVVTLHTIITLFNMYFLVFW
jgi:hypothetical protein